MTLTSGFFNSVASDRLYDAIQISSIFDGALTDGVYAAIGDHLLVSATTGMNITVGTGRAWFKHTWSYNDADVTLTVGQAHALQDRIDTVVLEINSDIGVRANSLKIIAGTPSADPQQPTLTHTETVNQYPLADILVRATVTTIYQDDITNRIGTTDCPFVTGLLNYITTNELLAQWEAQFMTWFDIMKDQLTTDAAGSLQLQIDGIKGDSNPPVVTLIGLMSHNHAGGGIGNYIDHLGIAPEGIWHDNLGLYIVREENIFDGAVTEDKLGLGAVSNTKLATAAVTVTKIADGAVTASKLGSGAVIAGKIATGGVSGTTQLADDIVDDTKVGNRVPQFYRRKGGSATNWDTPGTTTYIPTSVRMQGGAVRWTGTADTEGYVDITFSTAFSGSPNIFLSSHDAFLDLATGLETASSFRLTWKSDTTHTQLDFSWFAVGPE